MQTILLQIFKGCLPQILLGLFLNTLDHMLNRSGHNIDPCGTPGISSHKL